MTKEKLISVFEFYLHHSCFYGITPKRNPDKPWGYEHISYMCTVAIQELVPSGKIEKSMRWLGFIQGCLVTLKVFTLEDVKKHSMPDDERIKLERKQSEKC